MCVRNNPTLVATLRIGWFIKPFTLQTICQWRQPLGCLVEVCSGLLLTSSVGVVIVMFHPYATVPILKLFLSLLHSLIIVAYSCSCECRSTLILPLPFLCVCNNPTLVAALRIGWFSNPLTHQTVFQGRQPWGRLVEVFSRSPINISFQCHDCGV
jgi:hypothetical protein